MSTYRPAALVVDASINKCSSDSSEFLSNISNNRCFFSFLRYTIKYEGVRILCLDNDTDTTTVMETIYSDGVSANVVVDDTDILCFLLHRPTLLDLVKTF